MNTITRPRRVRVAITYLVFAILLAKLPSVSIMRKYDDYSKLTNSDHNQNISIDAYETGH
jgi:hypothetical protein